MHEIELSVSQPIIFGFEKLKHQNFYMSVQVEIFTISIQRAVCTLSLHVEIFGCPLRNHSLFKCRGAEILRGHLFLASHRLGATYFCREKFWKSPRNFSKNIFQGGEEGHFFGVQWDMKYNEIFWNLSEKSPTGLQQLGHANLLMGHTQISSWDTQNSYWATR